MLKSVALGDLEQEYARTRTLLERLPGDKLSWRPHERSWTLGELATHLVNLPTWQLATLTTDGFDLDASPPSRTSALPSRDALLETFDRNVAALVDRLENVSDDVLAEAWSMRKGDVTIWSRPRVEVVREWGISHMIHHRGQLTVYLRLLEVPVPGLYGPSGDDLAAVRQS